MLLKGKPENGVGVESKNVAIVTEGSLDGSTMVVVSEEEAPRGQRCSSRQWAGINREAQWLEIQLGWSRGERRMGDAKNAD